MNKLPRFEDLPLNKGDPYLSAWGLYGKDDQLGFLNRLTNEVVVEAAKEIKTGVRVNLDWALDAETKWPSFGRQKFHKQIYHKSPRVVNDDVWTFNTQSSSQWDGLRHYAYQKEAKFYNGVTLDDIHGEHATNVNGIHAWSEKGIVGRGILLDFHSWKLENNVEYDPMSMQGITLEQLKAVLKAQGTEIKFGDILITRTGFMAAHNAAPSGEVIDMTKGNPPGFGGVKATEETLKWIWENFSAVAGDQLAFELAPGEPGKELMFHEVLLAGWGCPIGELFDLERLAEECKKQKRYSFFLTSEPCKVPGGVASPPNILAIF